MLMQAFVRCHDVSGLECRAGPKALPACIHGSETLRRTSHLFTARSVIRNGLRNLLSAFSLRRSAPRAGTGNTAQGWRH